MSNLLKTLHFRVMLALALIGVLPLAIIGLSVATSDSQVMGEQSARELTGLASGLAGELHIYLDGALDTSQLIADLPLIVNAEPANAEHTLRQMFIHFSQFAHLAIISPSGAILATALPNRPLQVDAAALETAVKNGQQNWLVSTEPDTGHYAFVIYTPIRNSRREVTSVLVSMVDLQDVAGIFERVRASSNGEAFVLGSDGRIVLHPDLNLLQQKSGFPEIEPADDAPVGIGTMEYSTPAGAQIAGYAPISDYGWIVVVEKPRSAVFAPAIRSLQLTLAGLVVSALFAVLAAIYLAGRLVSPVKELAAAAQAFGSGDYTASLPEMMRGGGELDTLVTAFREMRQAISKRENALRQSEQRTRLHFQQTPLAAIEMDMDMRIRRWNPGAVAIFGYTREEAVGHNICNLIVPKNERQQVHQKISLALTGQRGSMHNTDVNITKSGNLITCEWYDTPLVDADGKVIALSAMASDVSERIKAETDLRRLADRLEAIHQIDKAILAAQSPDVVANTVLHHLQQLVPCQRGSVVQFREPNQFFDATILAAYADYETSLGVGRTVIYERQTMIDYMRQGKPFLLGDLAEETNLPQPDEFLYAEGIRCYLSIPLLAQGQLNGILHIGVKQPYAITQQQVVIVSEAAASLAIALQQAELNEQVQQHVSNQQDHIAQLQRAEAALVAERASLAHRVAERTAELSAVNLELTRANRLKDEFLATMSHELRTPLNSILGMGQVLEEEIYGAVNDKQLNALRIISSSGHHLLSLINDILDLSKIETGKMELDLRPVSVPDLCLTCLRMIGQEAHRKQLVVTSAFDHVVTSFMADERRLKQILVNLLNNAVKFTPNRGEIGLEVSVDAEAGTIEFVVWDTGIGIAKEDMGRLFQPFVQLDSRLARSYEGTGLGLALVQQLARLHRGSVSLESEPGKGSRFTVTLPFVPGAVVRAGQTHNGTPPQGLPGQPESGSPLVLLVEDNEANIAAIVGYLEHYGYRLSVVREGGEVLSTAQTLEPDLILMDIQLPGVDGLETTRRLRANAAFATVPIIALTALTMPGDREKCLAAGADDYIVKPANLNNLAQVIAKYLKTGAPEQHQ